MSIAQAVALNWRAITAFVMAAVQLATALGWLPVGSEEMANTLIATAGGVIAVIAGGSYVQNIATTRAITATAGAAEASARLGQAVAEAAPSPIIERGAARVLQDAARLTDLAGRRAR